MKIIALLLLVTLTSPAWGQNSAEFGWLGGAGDTPCSKWNEVRARKASTLAFALKSWVLGFVSGVNNAPNADRFLASFNEKDFMMRVDFYCRDHKTDLLAQATMIAVTDMLRASSNHPVNQR
jgi:hypothetical protein